VYIGQTNNLRKRHLSHLSEARRGDGSYFHAAIQKHGINSFVGPVVLDTCLSRTEANERENFWIAQHELKYNLTTGGERDFTISDTTRKKISLARKGKSWGRHTSETKQHLSEMTVGKKRSSQMRLKMANLKRRSYQITYPDGTSEFSTNLKSFCNEHQLDQGRMCHVAQGKRAHCHGFKVRYV
jgi:group I intron endonuclease